MASVNSGSVIPATDHAESGDVSLPEDRHPLATPATRSRARRIARPRLFASIAGTTASSLVLPNPAMSSSMRSLAASSRDIAVATRPNASESEPAPLGAPATRSSAPEPRETGNRDRSTFANSADARYVSSRTSRANRASKHAPATGTNPDPSAKCVPPTKPTAYSAERRAPSPPRNQPMSHDPAAARRTSATFARLAT